MRPEETLERLAEATCPEAAWEVPAAWRKDSLNRCSKDTVAKHNPRADFGSVHPNLVEDHSMAQAVAVVAIVAGAPVPYEAVDGQVGQAEGVPDRQDQRRRICSSRLAFLLGLSVCLCTPSDSLPRS